MASLAFVYLSFYEGFGLPPLEAMASGVPRLIEEEPLRTDLIQTGLVWAANFTWQRTVASTVEVYRRALT